MKRTEAALAKLGVPSRIGMFSGVRGMVAKMLVDHAREVGAAAFREEVEEVVAAVLKDMEEVR